MLPYKILFQHHNAFVGRVGWLTGGPTCSRILQSLKVAPNTMPEDFCMFGETHWGGCGCYGSTNGADVKGIALAIKGAVIIYEGQGDGSFAGTLYTVRTKYAPP